MKQSTKITVATLIGLIGVGGIAYAAQGYSEHREMRRAFAPERLFERIDTNKDGAASREEMLGLVTTYFNTADDNADGKVSKAEIVMAIDASAAPAPMKRRSGRIADRVLQQGDVNADGTLELAELENRLGKFHALADWNDDGRVEMAEAKRLRAGFGRHGRHGKQGRP